ncbi:MAG: ThuA domain-containing protein, partial [Clostridia bacterium]|nr:ThuA domain-containing protein [Clostridia bacterium]
MINVLIFNEFMHEQSHDHIKAIYPEGMHGAIRGFLEANDDISVECVTLFNENRECNDLENIITDEKLAKTDVIIWWGHAYHHYVPDSVALRVQNAVLGGMGAIFLHSGHHSKPFRYLMGTTCNVDWRENGDLCRLWIVDPSHPITKGLGRYIEVEHEETYCEPFGIPEPDKLVFIGWFAGGEVFRSGCCFLRDAGKIFYFQPGHETYPTYKIPEIVKIISNAVRWAYNPYKGYDVTCPHATALENN